MSALSVPEVFDPAHQQKIFRATLEAMARPGSVMDVGRWLGESTAAVGILASLCDGAIGLADPEMLLTLEDWRFLGCKRADVTEAAFVLADGRHPPEDSFSPHRGTLEAPESGATLVLEVTTLQGQHFHNISGPGVRMSRGGCLGGLHPIWLKRRNAWCASFPRGVDVLLCDRTRIVGLPRTTAINPTVSAQ